MKRNVVRRTGLLLLLAIVVLLPLPAGVAQADGTILPIPHAFYGNLTLNTGAPAPAGVIVTALVSGQVAGSITTTEAGKYGNANPLYDMLIVEGDIANGTPIQFFVGNVTATPLQPERAVFKSGEVTQLDLQYTPPPPAGGGGGIPPGPVLVIDVAGAVTTGAIDENGVVQDTVSVTTAGGELNLVISKGTQCLDKDGEPLTQLTVDVDPAPPSPPAGSNIIALPYNLGPNGATFNPPMTMTWHYTDADIPAGVAEEDLVIAYYDAAAGKWVEMECVVDPVNNTIIVFVSHFTTFAIISKPPAPTTPPTTTPPTTTPPAPAAFKIGTLKVTPAQVNVGEAVTISLAVTNTGGTSGTYEVTLKINGAVEATKKIEVPAGQSKDVTFTTTKNVAGTYSVEVDGLSSSFKVTEKVTATPTTPTTTPPTTTPPTTTPPVIPPVEKPTNWPLIGGIIGAVVVVLVILLAVRRKAARKAA